LIRVAALVAGIGASVLAVSAHAASANRGATSVLSGRWNDATIDDYRKHLMALTVLVEACAKARDLKNCDPMLVGPDDRIPLGSEADAERRLVRYGWLRVLFSKADEPDEPALTPDRAKGRDAEPATSQPPPPTTGQLLQLAEKRLAIDLAQSGTSAVPPPAHSAERDAMKQVLAGRDFRDLEQPTVRDSILEKVGNWLNRRVTKLRVRSAWFGRFLAWGFILGVCVAQVWGLLQLERKWRIRLVSEEGTPSPAAASARDWQLWLDDARRAAASRLWREAIHFVYWAAISRLESRRLWPADCARTPREYLALVAPGDPRRAGLAALTRSFERTWYGGKPAGASDYRRAEEIASVLIAGSGTSGIEDLSAAAEGGAE
jgi:hypothetical protein